MRTPALLNGAASNVGTVQLARATAIQNILNKRYGIKDSRMNATTGTNFSTPVGRTVEIHVRGLNL